MDKKDRELLVEHGRKALDLLHKIWVMSVTLSPDDSRLQSDARDAYQNTERLVTSLVSIPDHQAEGSRRCAWCDRQTEVPF